MKKIFALLLILVSSFSYAEFDNSPQAQLDRLRKSFANSDSYDFRTKRAQANMLANINAAENKKTVENLLRRSGVDLETGAKTVSETKVTQPVNTGAAAKDLVSRLGKAKEFAKNAGKASIPAFLGGAAVQALVDGVGWVMDEGGKVTRPADLASSYYPYYVKYYYNSQYEFYYGNTKPQACSAFMDRYQDIFPPDGGSQFSYYRYEVIDSNCDVLRMPINTKAKTETIWTNPNYVPNQPLPQPVEVSPAELEAALKNALESNNAALASAIAAALKAAYTYDRSEGQDAQSNALATAVIGDLNQAHDLSLESTGSEPTSSGKVGYYKITDGEKTIEGYAYPSPTTSKTDTTNTSTTITDPVTGATTTTGSGSSTTQIPPFCDWAGIVCEWIGWTKEEPVTDEPILPTQEITQQQIDDTLISTNGKSCPNDIVFNEQFAVFNMHVNKVIQLQPYCDKIEPLKYAFMAATLLLCGFLLVRV